MDLLKPNISTYNITACSFLSFVEAQEPFNFTSLNCVYEIFVRPSDHLLVLTSIGCEPNNLGLTRSTIANELKVTGEGFEIQFVSTDILSQERITTGFFKFGFATNQFDEIYELMQTNTDFASGQHQIALSEQAKGNIEDAKRAYRKGIELDSYNNFSRINLALILYEQGDTKGAETLYLKVTEQQPNYSYSSYMLGLLYHGQAILKMH